MILFESGWETYAVNYLKSEALARGIIYNAAWGTTLGQLARLRCP